MGVGWCGGLGHPDGHAHGLQLGRAQGISQPRELVPLLMRGVVQDCLADRIEPLIEVVDLGAELVELRQQLLGVALLLQAGVGDLLAARDQQPHLGVQHLLLSSLVHRQQAYQLLERLPPRLATALLHLGERPPDLCVLFE